MLKIKHRDFDIEFDTNSEEWKCGALALSDKSLSKLKTTIDREGKKRRRVNVKALYLHEGYRNHEYVYTIKVATIVLLREGDRKADVTIEGVRGQDQVDIRELYPFDQRKKLEVFIAAKERAAAAEKEAGEAQEAIEPLTAQAIREAVVRNAEEAS